MEAQHLLFILLALLGLWLGSVMIINSSIRAAKRSGISEMFVGLTLLGLGTQLPFIFNSFQAAFDQLHGKEILDSITVSAVAANLTLISLVLGVGGLISAYHVKRAETSKNGMMLIASTLMVFILASDGFISPFNGALMLLFYGVYLFWLHRMSGLSGFKIKLQRLCNKPVLISFIKIAAGLGIVFFSSNFLLKHLSIIFDVVAVDSVSIGQVLLKILFFGIGASLPSTVVALTAAVKGSKKLSLGVIIGSSISSLLVALGGSALVSGWVVERRVARFDLAYLLFTCTIVVLFLLTRKKLDRKESFLILCLYAVYLVLNFFV